MTKQSDVISDPKYVAVLDHGFIGLIDHMGSDGAIVQAARTSYGDGTKTVNEDRGLIRYLMRHKHTSPFEMCEIKLHVKMPIFVMRQWVRHRTASLNEYSGRYSVMTDEFYLPEFQVIKPQAKDNKQGRSGEVSQLTGDGVRWMMEAANTHAYDIYKALLGDFTDDQKASLPYDPYDPSDQLFDDDFDGIARELARTVLPVSNYTELYWKQNLHNMMHLLKLRMDAHAQYEIRVFADAVYAIIQPLFPEAIQAFEDYVRLSHTLSRMEVTLTEDLIQCGQDPVEWFKNRLLDSGSDKVLAEAYGLSIRELREFATKWKLPVTADLTQPVLVCSLEGEGCP
jgi:thymidylate synthase (FAD)